MDPYKNIKTMFSEFPGYDRFVFPDGIWRITAGRGGECYLIAGDEKIALYDCGMAYCHKELISNIEEILADIGRDAPDYVLMSHTHYDHIGAVPYLIDRWPDIRIMGAQKAVSVFASENARATMKRLGENARARYGTPDGEDIKVDGLRVDRVLREGDEVDLGGRKVVVYETPGHTDCSLSYHLLPDDLLFLSESIGLTRGPDLMHTSILKSYWQCDASAHKCEAIGAKHLVSSHYGLVPEYYSKQYYTDYYAAAKAQYDLAKELTDRGCSYEETLEEFKNRYWSEIRGRSQPFEAFMENARIIVRNLIKTVLEDENAHDKEA